MAAKKGETGLGPYGYGGGREKPKSTAPRQGSGLPGGQMVGRGSVTGWEGANPRSIASASPRPSPRPMTRIGQPTPYKRGISSWSQAAQKISARPALMPPGGGRPQFIPGRGTPMPQVGRGFQKATPGTKRTPQARELQPRRGSTSRG